MIFPWSHKISMFYSIDNMTCHSQNHPSTWTLQCRPARCLKVVWEICRTWPCGNGKIIELVVKMVEVYLVNFHRFFHVTNGELFHMWIRGANSRENAWNVNGCLRGLTNHCFLANCRRDMHQTPPGGILLTHDSHNLISSMIVASECDTRHQIKVEMRFISQVDIPLKCTILVSKLYPHYHCLFYPYLSCLYPHLWSPSGTAIENGWNPKLCWKSQKMSDIKGSQFLGWNWHS